MHVNRLVLRGLRLQATSCALGHLGGDMDIGSGGDIYLAPLVSYRFHENFASDNIARWTLRQIRSHSTTTLFAHELLHLGAANVAGARSFAGPKMSLQCESDRRFSNVSRRP